MSETKISSSLRLLKLVELFIILVLVLGKSIFWEGGWEYSIKQHKILLNLIFLIFLVYFYWKKDIGIGILKSIKNKIITFKLFQEQPHKINQRQERAQRFKICGSFVHFTIIFVLKKKYLKLLTVRIKKFLNHHSIGDRFSKKKTRENIHRVSFWCSQQHSHCYRLQHV